jgi:uncharacterized protein
MSEYALKLNEFDTEPKEFRFVVTAAWIGKSLGDTEVTAAGPDEGSFVVLAQRSGEGVLVQAHLSAALSVPCARCLGPVPIPVESDVTLLFTERPEIAPSGDDDEDDDNYGRETFSGETLVLDDVVREHLLLEVPMQPHCTDPACVERWEKSVTADERRGDPRLQGLAALKAKLPPKR